MDKKTTTWKEYFKKKKEAEEFKEKKIIKMALKNGELLLFVENGVAYFTIRQENKNDYIFSNYIKKPEFEALFHEGLTCMEARQILRDIENSTKEA